MRRPYVTSKASVDESDGHILGAFTNKQRKTSRFRRARPSPKFEKSNPSSDETSSDDDIISLNVGGRSLLTSRYSKCTDLLHVIIYPYLD